MGATAEHDVEQLRARLNDYMARHGLRSTEQRRVVTEMFFASEGHLSIEELLDQVRLKEPRIGYATVYRTLKLLKECGLAFERHFGDGVSRYEVAWSNEHHDHLICVECEKIIEFEDDDIEVLQHQVAAKHGFKLVRHKLELYGVCPDCRAKR
jgi:Fur family transcriptional regulator, ferric uptake regulator